MKFANLALLCSKFVIKFVQNKIGLYKPYFAQYELLYKCNLKCVFCNVYKDKTYDKTEISAENAIQLLTQLKQAGILFINFTGGEPFLKKDFIKIIKHAKKLGFLVTMNDNGLLLKRFAPLVKDYVDSIHVSLDSHDAETYESIRGVHNIFSKTLEGIREAKKHGIHVAINMTVTKINFDKMEEFCRFIENYYVDVFLTIVSVIPTEFCDTSESKDIIVNRKRYAKKVLELKRKYKFIKTSNAYLDFVAKGGFNNYKCLAMRTSINIKPDGSIVLPCGYFSLNKFKGNINVLKTHKNFKEATKYKSYSFCKNCTLSCFFIPTSMLDTKYLLSMFNSYAKNMWRLSKK